MSYYTKEEIEEILDIICSAKLKAPSAMFEASVEDLQKICNGVGPSSFPKKLRKAVSAVCKCATATAAVHDWQYHHSDGYPGKQDEADALFLRNGYAELKFLYPGWRNFFKRKWCERKVSYAFRLLETGGESAWCVEFRNNTLNIKR